MLDALDYRIWCIRHWWRELPDKIAWRIAYLLPDRLVYLATVRLWAWASVQGYPNQHVGSITIDKALDCWKRRRAQKEQDG